MQFVADKSGDAVTSKRRATALTRRCRAKDATPAKLIAYDFETTSIKPGTPDPVYLTAYAPDFHFDGEIRGMKNLHHILTIRFLIEETKGCKFVAWNGNNFDVFFVAAALVMDNTYIIRPYLTRSNSVRGIRVILRADVDNPKAPAWEFLDGIAMLGLVGTPLSKFLANFAPDFLKLTGTIDFEKEQFDPKNKKHRDYAFRDSEGLWHGMNRAQQIMLENFNQPLTVTMGGACIKIFTAHIPDDVTVNLPRDEVLELTRTYVMRGGYCHCAKRYEGLVWKYDINQAYASAMRAARLPQGFTTHGQGKPPEGRPAIVRITAHHSTNIVPFYYRAEIKGKITSCFDCNEILDTWLTTIEYEQLISEGWKVTVYEHYAWDDSFNMQEFVDKLETLRTTCDGGPSGPIGTMVKATGNHSYGKTVEVLEPLEFLLAAECPPGYVPYYGDDIEPLEHVYVRYVQDQRPKDYHQPQIGAFITAHVRMVLRRAALLRPDHWLYADTDCVVFSSDVTDLLDIDSKRYGAWKIEESGTPYRIITKKVYAQIDGDKRSAKGMNVKKLTPEQFEQWFHGAPPQQLQTQRNNFLIVMRGAEMFRAQLRTGTRINV